VQVYHASRVHVPKRACRRVSGNKPNENQAVVAERMPSLPESAKLESLDKLFANILAQIGLRVCRRDIRNRPAYALPYRSC